MRGDTRYILIVDTLEEVEELVLLDGYLVVCVGLWVVVVRGLEHREIVLWFGGHLVVRE